MTVRREAPVGVLVDRVNRTLWVVAAALVAASVAGTALHRFGGVRSLGLLRRFFAFEAEANLPNWWTTLLMVAIALLCLALARVAPDRWSGRRWRWLSWIFTAMSLVEATQLREDLIKPMRDRFDLGGVLYYAWVVPGVIVVVAVAAVFTQFVLRQPRRLRTGIALAAVLYVGGALGLEMVGGQLEDSRGRDDLFYVLVDVEETAELVALTTLATTLTTALAGSTFVIRLLGGGAPTAVEGTERLRPRRTVPLSADRRPEPVLADA